jgi:hypothetical protein
MSDDKYKNLKDELSEFYADREAMQRNLEQEKGNQFKDLMRDKAEIKSGMRIYRKKRKDYWYRFKLWFWRILKIFY